MQTVAELQSKPEGGDAWLMGLREVPYPEASAALCTLMGVGPKVRMFEVSGFRRKTLSDSWFARGVLP